MTHRSQLNGRLVVTGTKRQARGHVEVFLAVGACDQELQRSGCGGQGDVHFAGSTCGSDGGHNTRLVADNDTRCRHIGGAIDVLQRQLEDGVLVDERHGSACRTVVDGGFTAADTQFACSLSYIVFLSDAASWAASTSAFTLPVVPSAAVAG